MKEKLKSCPFCGGTAEIIEEGAGFNIKCADCYVEMTPFATDKRDAIKMWNDRPIEDKVQKKIEKLKAENARLREALEKIIDRAEKEESKASKSTYGFAYDI